MIEFLAALQDSDLAQMLRQSRWVYPIVNAAHILGIALLIGAVIPMDLRLIGALNGPDLSQVVAFLRPFAIAGLCLAVAAGIALFLVQARDYVVLRLFWIKISLIALAAMNALWHLRRPVNQHTRRSNIVAGITSLLLWPCVLLCGRLIAYQ